MKSAQHAVKLLFRVLLAFAVPAGAAPMIGNAYVLTDNFSPNTVGFPNGHTFIVGADGVTDPLGVPNNIRSVEATALTAGQSDYSLPFTTLGSAFSGVFQRALPYDAQQGRWSITVTNEQDETASKTTNNLGDPQLIPFAENLRATGVSLAPLITWDPVLFDYDMDPNTPDTEVDANAIRLLKDSNTQFFRSSRIFGNSYQVPEGLIVPGLTTIRLLALDLRGPNRRVENRSSTFTNFVAVTEPTTVVLLGLGFSSLSNRHRKLRRVTSSANRGSRFVFVPMARMPGK